MLTCTNTVMVKNDRIYYQNIFSYSDDIFKDIRKMKMVVGRSINMAISVRGREGLRGIGCEELVTSKGIEMHSRMIPIIRSTWLLIPVNYERSRYQ